MLLKKKMIFFNTMLLLLLLLLSNTGALIIDIVNDTVICDNGRLHKIDYYDIDYTPVINTNVTVSPHVNGTTSLMCQQQKIMPFIGSSTYKLYAVEMLPNDNLTLLCNVNWVYVLPGIDNKYRFNSSILRLRNYEEGQYICGPSLSVARSSCYNIVMMIAFQK